MNMRNKLRSDLLDERIVNLVGMDDNDEPRIYYVHADTPKDLYIEYQFYNKTYTDWSCNKNISDTHYIQIDIFSKELSEGFFKLQDTLENVFKEKGYKFRDSADFYESESGLYHKGFRFTYKDILNTSN